MVSRPALEVADSRLGRATCIEEEVRMIAFLIDLENKPGTLASVAEALGTKGVNITGVAGASCGDSGRAAITTADDTAARQVFQSLKVPFKEYETTEVSLANSPGSLGKAARRLSNAGVNIEAILPAGMSGSNVSVAFVTNNAVKAKEILATAGAAR
jgi:hypothetical protein